MQYSQASVSNLALGRLGARGQITDINEDSPNAVKILAIWDAVLQEVLSERDWKFAKTRVQLQLSPVTPLYGYRSAWALPSDLLRFVRPHKMAPDRTFAWMWGPEGNGWYPRNDPPFWPSGYTYVVETLTSGWLLAPPADPIPYPDPFPAGKYLLTNYDGSCGPAAINYIQLISDYTQLAPGFVNCLAWRLAAELAVAVSEDKQKFQGAWEMYKESLNSSEATNESLDFSYEETGDYSWLEAGRHFRFR